MSKADDFLTYAQSELGKPYVFGAEGPSTFDCSGLVQYALAHVGIHSPRTAHEQQAWAKTVSTPRPGDLVFYGWPAHHVGIFLGGGKMLDAPHSGAVVRIEGVGHPTNYGRVPGLGGAAVAVGGVVAPVVQTVASVLSPASWFSGISAIAWEAVFGALGLTLVGVGVYRLAVKPAGRKFADNLNLGGTS